jgi:transposase
MELCIMKLHQSQTQFNCGIDLHAKNMYLCVMDKEGKKLLHKNIKTHDRQCFQELLAPYRHDLTVACESTFNWHVVSDMCEDAGIPFVLGHAFYMKAIHKSKVKNDRVDSETIASLLRGNLLPSGYVCRRHVRSVRDLFRRRTYLVRQRAALESHLTEMGHLYDFSATSKDFKRRAGRLQAYARQLPGDFGVQMSAAADIRLIEALRVEILSIEKAVMRHAKGFDRELLELLQTIPGTGPVISLGILYEADDFSRFADCGHFISYCRLVTPLHESGGKVTGEGHRKNGNPYLKWMFSELNAAARRHSNELSAFAQLLVNRHGPRKAACMFSHKLGRAVFCIATERVPFNLEKFLGGPMKKR